MLTMCDHSKQRCYQLTQSVTSSAAPSAGVLSLLNHVSVNNKSLPVCARLALSKDGPGQERRPRQWLWPANANHTGPWPDASTRVAHRGPPATISNPPALPDMETNHRRAAATPPIGVRLRLTGPRTGVLVKM